MPARFRPVLHLSVSQRDETSHPDESALALPPTDIPGALGNARHSLRLLQICDALARECGTKPTLLSSCGSAAFNLALADDSHLSIRLLRGPLVNGAHDEAAVA